MVAFPLVTVLALAVVALACLGQYRDPITRRPQTQYRRYAYVAAAQLAVTVAFLRVTTAFESFASYRDTLNDWAAQSLVGQLAFWLTVIGMVLLVAGLPIAWLWIVRHPTELLRKRFLRNQYRIRDVPGWQTLRSGSYYQQRVPLVA